MTQIPTEQITDTEFKSFANQALDTIENELERLFETSDFDVDLNRQGGVLEISFPNNTVIVINLQTPLHELWVAAKEGGFHFKWVGSKEMPQWNDTKTGEDFFSAVSRYISTQGGVAFGVNPSFKKTS
jgi:CyaY protein